DLVRPAELGALVLEHVEAVRAVGDHLPKSVPVDRLDMVLLERLVEMLLAEPPGDFAVAPLLLHDAKAHPRRPEDLHHRPGDRLVAPVVRRRAAHPVEVLHLLAGSRYRHVEPVRSREWRAGWE